LRVLLWSQISTAVWQEIYRGVPPEVRQKLVYHNHPVDLSAPNRSHNPLRALREVSVAPPSNQHLHSAHLQQQLLSAACA